MAKFAWPPPTDHLRRVAQKHHTVRGGSLVARIYGRVGRYLSAWNDFRFTGPLPSVRFDHHVEAEQRGVLYGARSLTTCVAEVFRGARVVDPSIDDRCSAPFRVARAVRLVDLTGDWPTRAGASQAMASGPRTRAQAWARAMYEAYPSVEGLWYPSSMHGGHPDGGCGRASRRAGTQPTGAFT